ncbi:hypothetical protein CC86DRAFT_24287 [Ophiobolus disseminans]|uniref:Geranylgeranyl pyrophosphate synthetase n=1 Tax=Ophiobolus disseminans TaxID=1469910 RepID=A0A6A7A2U4_9PLEO|nr:hypothetical protein CC86DRAFT_24287 [Ophiobolus disseminans]
MCASGERSSDGEHGHNRKRSKVGPGPSGPESNQPVPPPVGFQSNDPFSFEAKIAMALQGAKWQELLQSGPSTNPGVEPSEDVQDGVTEGIELPKEQKPAEMTAKQKKKKEQFTRTIARDAGHVLQTIESDAIIPGPQEVTWDKDPELLCCYNWQGTAEENTIFVPGAPGRWQPPSLPHTLEKDSGYQYADYNYARQPRKPYEPMFQALTIMNPSYQFTEVDVLADRNNLRILLEFVSGKANGPFRLDLYSLFDTLVIVRNESSWWKYSDGRSFGCNFERFFTTPTQGMEDATSHYRAIRYSMGPLSVVCRFEADAYDDGVAADDLTTYESAAVSGGLTERPTFKFGAPIRVLQKGHIVPTSQMVELKTQAYHGDDYKLVACQDQLWFGRTKLLYTGPYELGTGVVSRLRIEDATKRVKNWEEHNQDNLRKLVALLTQLRAIVKTVRNPNHGAVLVREDKGGPLSVRSMESNSRAVERESFQTHWRRDTPQYVPQTGGFKGQGKGYHQGPRGGGYDNRGGGYPRGGGQYHTPNGYADGARGGGYAGRGHYQGPPQGYGNGYADGERGGQYASRRRGGGYDRGGSAPTDAGRGGRGSGYERGGYGRGDSYVRRPNY